LASIQEPHLLEQSLEQRLLPWIEHHPSSQVHGPIHQAHRPSVDHGSRPQFDSGHRLTENESTRDIGNSSIAENVSDSTATAAANSILDMTVQAMSQGAMEDRWGNEGTGEVTGNAGDDGFDYAGLEVKLQQ
jgi:hypothetical protein